MENVAEIVLFLGGIQGVLLSVFLFTLKANRLSNRLMGLLTFLWGIFLFAYGLQFEGLYVKYPHLLKVFYQFLFIFSPLLYLHAKYLLADYDKFQKKDLLHFIPFVLSVLLYSSFFIHSADVKLIMIRDKSEYYRILQVIGDEFIAIQGIVYPIVILSMVGKYKRRIKEYESTVSKTLIHALYIGTSLNLLAWSIGFIGIQFKYLPYDINVDFFTMTYLVMVVVIYLISYFAIKSPEIFKLEEKNIRVVYMRNPINILKNAGTGQAVKRYLKMDNEADNDILNPELEEVDEKLIDYMEKDKPFLDPDLTLPELAKSLEVSRNQLSNIINKKHGVNFYQFVNQYRVKEVKELMEDPSNSNLKLISLAYDAGFNSKASFNRIFKQMTKMTPSEFYSRHKKAV
jgi:AraC-like DNA-binding protein